MNRAFLVIFDLLGANSYMWKRRHTRLHHNFPNVAGWDSDIEKSKFLKVHPKENKKIFSRKQELMLLLYPFFIINWFFIRDFQDFFSSKTIVSKLGKIPRLEYFKLFFFKLVCIGYLVVIPAMITPFSWVQTLIAELILLISCGFFALLVLLPPHVNTNNQFPVVDENNKLEHSWLLHQLSTTNDVNGNNWFVTHVMGNFNLHLAHHLFPDISYVYAREVTQTIRKFSLKNKLPYRSYPLLSTLVEHYRLIRGNRIDFNIMEEEM